MTGASVAELTQSRRVHGPDGIYKVTADHPFREGNDVVLKLTITCAETTRDCNTETDFNRTRPVPPVPGWIATDPQADTTAGSYLLDSALGDEYIPLYNGYDAALASPIGARIVAGQALSIGGCFPAAPPSVSSVDLMMPGALARIANVPISPAP